MKSRTEGLKSLLSNFKMPSNRKEKNNNFRRFIFKVRKNYKIYYHQLNIESIL